MFALVSIFDNLEPIKIEDDEIEYSLKLIQPKTLGTIVIIYTRRIILNKKNQTCYKEWVDELIRMNGIHKLFEIINANREGDKIIAAIGILSSIIRDQLDNPQS